MSRPLPHDSPDEGGSIQIKARPAILASLITFLIYTVLVLVAPPRLAYNVDAGLYLAGAQGLAKENKYQQTAFVPPEPITLYPPAQSVYLSLFWRADPDYPGNVRLLDFGMVLLTSASAGLIAALCMSAGGGALGSVLAALIFVSSPNWMTATAFLVSEPLFMVIGLSALLLARTRPYPQPLVIGSLLALLYLTRIAGQAFVAGIAFALMYRRQWRILAIGGLPVCAGVISWQVYLALHPRLQYASFLPNVHSTSEMWQGYFHQVLANARSLFSGLSSVDASAPMFVRIPQVLGRHHPLLGTLGDFLLFLTGVTVLYGGIAGLSRDLKQNLPVVAGLAIYLAELLFWPFPADQRFAALINPLLFMGIFLSLRRWNEAKRPILGAVLFILASNLWLCSRQKEVIESWNFLDEVEKTSQWIRENTDRRALISGQGEIPCFDFHVRANRKLINLEKIPSAASNGQPVYSVARRSTNTPVQSVFSTAHYIVSRVNP